MDIKRYIVIQAVINTDTNELIPIWDDKIVFEKHEMYGNIITLKNSYKHCNVVECIYDLKTKEIQPGIELDYYPNVKDLEYKSGETVFFEKSHKKLGIAKISEIIFEEYELVIHKGKKIDKWWKERFKDVTFDDNLLYAIKSWKPIYVLDNGTKIYWEHQLYHKAD